MCSMSNNNKETLPGWRSIELAEIFYAMNTAEDSRVTAIKARAKKLGGTKYSFIKAMTEQIEHIMYANHIDELRKGDQCYFQTI